MGSFEEARHQGYSEADMAADMEEAEIRATQLGCQRCKYQTSGSASCERVFLQEDLYRTCPYFKQKEA